MKQEFIRPRLIGQRFNEHSLPLEILKDFSALEGMIIEIATREFRSANPHRIRLPKGFRKGLELHLTDLEEGSAVAVIALVFSTLFPSSDAEYLDLAKTKVVEAIASVERGEQPALAPDLLRYFDQFGRGLQEGEAIQMTRSNGQVVSLTQETREKLLRASHAELWTEEMALKGFVPETDQADMTFELELRDGQKLKAPLVEQHVEAVLEAFSGYRKGQLVAVQGVVKRDRSNRLKNFDSIEHITLLDALDVETRLEELASLKPGWLDGKGLGFEEVALKEFAQDFDRHFDPEIPLPHIYPTAEGGLQAEWSIGDWEISLELNLGTRSAEYQALQIASKQSKDLCLDLNPENSDWDKLNAELRSLLGARI